MVFIFHIHVVNQVTYKRVISPISWIQNTIHMKKLTPFILSFVLLISCGTTKKLPEEKLEVLKAYAITISDHKKTIYYKSIHENSKFLKEWIGIIKNMNVMVGFYDEELLSHQKQTIDSMIDIKQYTYAQKDSIKDSVLERTRIKPWELLTYSDEIYMARQVKNYKTKKWTNLQQYYNLVREKEATHISIPILSKSGKYAIIFIRNPGSSKSLWVFKKENEEWKFYFESTLVIYD